MSRPKFILREKTLGTLLDETVARTPDNDALVCQGTDFRLTWRELGELTDRLAKGLMALGLKKGQKFALWAANVPYWIPFQFATAKIGAILVTVNTNYREHELRYLIKQSECDFFCLSDGVRDYKFLDTFDALVPERLSAENRVIESAEFPNLKRIVWIGSGEGAGMFTVSDLLELADTVSDGEYAERRASVDPHDVINMQYTSGTTGFPKGVMLTHAGLGQDAYWTGQGLALTEKDRLCLPVPLFHSIGCVLGSIACVCHGSAILLVENFSPLGIFAFLEKERATALHCVPSMFLSMLERHASKRYDISSLRTGIMGGAICPEPLLRRVMEEMHLPELSVCYGLTECSPTMTQAPHDDTFEHRCRTVGCALPGVEVRIVDPETMEERPRGETGEIVCRGYIVMRGYYNMPEETAKTITPDGWMHTGDLGVMDEDGYISVTGRSKDMILRGGENVYPREVEEFLLTMPGVHDVQVVGVPSRKYGEEVGAFIIPQEGADISLETVRAFARGKFAWYKVPRYVAVLDAFPLTGSGKVQKFKLREQAATLWAEAMRERPVRRRETQTQQPDM